ncbi:MAG: hypothetical protein AAF481_14880 [Acidobacteriota bacterium]
MDLETLLFLLVALLAVASAVLATQSRHAGIASRSRAAFLLSLAPLYSQLGAPYLGLLQLCWALSVAWKGRSAGPQDSRSETPWLPTAGLLAVGVLSATLWWSTYRDFPRRPPRGAVATLWERPADLLEPLSLVGLMFILAVAVGWAARQPVQGDKE